MSKELNELIKDWEKHKEYDFDAFWNKVKNSPVFGCKVNIFWGGGLLKGVIDEGYVFSLPICDSDPEAYDFFVHIPHPENPGGIGDVEGQFIHIVNLITNDLVTRIEFQP